MFARASDGAPGPVACVADEACPDGVVQDVLDRGLEVLLVVDHPGGEALAEECAATSVAGVVLSRVVALVPLGGPREVFRTALEDRVVVRPHQAVDVVAEVEADERSAEQRQEQQPVEGVQEERSLVHAVRGHVEVAVRQLGAKDSSHAPTVRLQPGPDAHRGTSSPLLARLWATRRVSDTRRGPKGHGATRRGARRVGRRSSASGRGRRKAGR
jgi:hypothetical protein